MKNQLPVQEWWTGSESNRESNWQVFDINTRNIPNYSHFLCCLILSYSAPVMFFLRILRFAPEGNSNFCCSHAESIVVRWPSLLHIQDPTVQSLSSTFEKDSRLEAGGDLRYKGVGQDLSWLEILQIRVVNAGGPIARFNVCNFWPWQFL